MFRAEESSEDSDNFSGLEEDGFSFPPSKTTQKKKEPILRRIVEKPQQTPESKVTYFSENSSSKETNESYTQDELKNAISRSNLTEIKKILVSGIDVNTTFDSNWSPLMHAAKNADEEIVEYLLQNGANPNFEFESETPIIVACYSSKAEEKIANVVQVLIKYKANVETRNEHKVSPLMYAARNNYCKVVDILLNNGVNADAQDEKGYTALIWAAEQGRMDTVRLLLERGCNNTIRSRRGNATDVAHEQGFHTIARLVERYNDKKTTQEILDEIQREEYEQKMNNNDDYEDIGYVGDTELDMFLHGSGLGEMADLFRKNHIDFEIFLGLNEKDLENLKIVEVGKRKKVLNLIKEFNKAPWKSSSIPVVKFNESLSFVDVESIIGNIKNHTGYINQTLKFTEEQLSEQGEKIINSLRGAMAPGDVRILLEKAQENTLTLRDRLKRIDKLLSQICDGPEREGYFGEPDKIDVEKLKKIEFVKNRYYWKYLSLFAGIFGLGVLINHYK